MNETRREGSQSSVSFNPRAGSVRHDGGMTLDSRHLSERINRSADEVYVYASDPANLPKWAPGLGDSVEQVDGQWFVGTPTGRVRVAFAPRNDFGILDHHVTLDSGEVVYVPMRVITNEEGSEVLFTLWRRPGMTDAEFGADADAVAADIARLKHIMENVAQS